MHGGRIDLWGQDKDFFWGGETETSLPYVNTPWNMVTNLDRFDLK